ncbi:conserved hypothetical protein [Culex quinquefasciatus]|uniref:Uncharacterized protein n=1 Tax=Culex quinquefasciatus TaxID=7176 RepID=B0WNL4_CULQU|nr:conserved hypothetical protein [Culex quinquefasciatus]|eukprot:XP_001850298.1 conserved hypothetical protein [Culex quinquefasciatus]
MTSAAGSGTGSTSAVTGTTTTSNAPGSVSSSANTPISTNSSSGCQPGLGTTPSSSSGIGGSGSAGGGSQGTNGSPSAATTGSGTTGSTATIIDDCGASRVFQILYRNEEVSLRDVIMFRAHLLVDSRHLKESIERAEFSLNLELWFGEQTTGNVLSLASTRTLQLNFHPGRGLHYHLPVLFDYFHLAAVSVGIHASLVALHQPYINRAVESESESESSKLEQLESESEPESAKMSNYPELESESE